MCERDLMRALHDLAHAMIAPRKRRQLPEFGLGPDPANMQNNMRRVVSRKAAQAEEAYTCDLHWCLAAYLEGEDGAQEVENYVDTTVPAVRVIMRFGRRFARMLPRDFIDVVLETRHDRSHSA